MTFYERKIRYLDYLEYENKIKNAGFVKTEVRDENCQFQIMIKGLYPTDTLQGEIFLLGQGRTQKVDTILLRFGTSSYMALWGTENLAGSGISYEKWDGIEIRLSEHRVLRNIWREHPGGQVQLAEEVPAKEDRQAEEVPAQEVWQVEETLGTEVLEVQRDASESGPQPEIAAESLGEAGQKEPDKIPREELREEPKEEPALEQERFQTLYEDKWTQLTRYYRKMRPFGDGREYLSIRPEDFIILQEKYQKLVGNSFLLHGYYNYGHVILERQKEDGCYRYYLGVPGIYHEREKQVAGMFGFVGFEGAASPCAEGSFGYYMLPVEI